MEGYIIIGLIIFIVALLVLYITSAYNKLVKRFNRVKAQWAQIDVQLTRRNELIPKLMEIVKDYVSHEKEIFEKVIDARNGLEAAVSSTQVIAANDQLSSQLQRLIAIALDYPDLKSNENFIHLQSCLQETEDKIAYARQFYNDTVLLYQDKVHQFPSSIIAKIFHFKDELFYIPDRDSKGDIKTNR